MLPSRFLTYIARILRTSRVKRKTGEAQQSVVFRQISLQVFAHHGLLVMSATKKATGGGRLRFMVDGRWISRQIARKPRRAPPSWNMTALIQGGPSPTLNTTANSSHPFARPSTFLPDVLRLCHLSFLTTLAVVPVRLQQLYGWLRSDTRRSRVTVRQGAGKCDILRVVA